MKFKRILLVLSFSFHLMACSVEIISPYEIAPEIEIKEVVVPSTIIKSSDYGAQKTLDVIKQVNRISDYNFYFSIPLNAKNQGKNRLFVENNGLTTVYEFSLENGWYDFQIFLSGMIDGFELDNFNVIYGSVSARTTIDILSYDQKEHGNWSYIFSPSDVLQIDYSKGPNTSQVIAQPDGSGKLTVKNSREIVFESSWNPDGSGSWKEYENGEINKTGLWD